MVLMIHGVAKSQTWLSEWTDCFIGFQLDEDNWKEEKKMIWSVKHKIYWKLIFT